MTPIPTNLRQFLWHCTKPHRKVVAFIICTGVIDAVFLNLLGPYCLKRIIDALVEASTGPQAITSILMSSVIYVFLWLGVLSNLRVTDWLRMRLLPAVRQTIILHLFQHLKRHSTRMFQDNFAGDLSNKIFDVTDGGTTILERLDQAFTCCASLVIALLAMYLLHPAFAVILLIWGSFFFGLSMRFLGKISGLSFAYSEHNSRLVGRVVDSVSNIANVRMFAGHTHEQAYVGRMVDTNVRDLRALHQAVLKMRIVQDALMIVFVCALLGTAVYLFQAGSLTVGDFAMLMSVAVTSFQIIWYLADQFVNFTEAWGKCEQGLSVIAAPHDVVDTPTAAPLCLKGGRIEFEDVKFLFQPDRPIFEDKSVIIEAGQKVGLVGASGSGKSTFVNLILRNFDLDGGRILIDGQDIANVTQDTLRSAIAMIAQDTSLFHRSLMENIRYGRLDATDDEVIDAARLACCDEFIETLPEQYQTLVGDRGVKLSGGQRQRISIARAILKDAPILILDEATSALDTHTEYQIQQALHALMDTRTTIVIAHRLSTLVEMDRILVFRDGRIIEDGAPGVLASGNGAFAEMWRLQAQGAGSDLMMA
jgi:ATP-binding cassette subfamily B protein